MCGWAHQKKKNWFTRDYKAHSTVWIKYEGKLFTCGLKLHPDPLFIWVNCMKGEKLHSSLQTSHFQIPETLLEMFYYANEQDMTRLCSVNLSQASWEIDVFKANQFVQFIYTLHMRMDYYKCSNYGLQKKWVQIYRLWRKERDGTQRGPTRVIVYQRLTFVNQGMLLMRREI